MMPKIYPLPCSTSNGKTGQWSLISHLAFAHKAVRAVSLTTIRISDGQHGIPEFFRIANYLQIFNDIIANTYSSLHILLTPIQSPAFEIGSGQDFATLPELQLTANIRSGGRMSFLYHRPHSFTHSSPSGGMPFGDWVSLVPEAPSRFVLIWFLEDERCYFADTISVNSIRLSFFCVNFDHFFSFFFFLQIKALGNLPCRSHLLWIWMCLVVICSSIFAPGTALTLELRARTTLAPTYHALELL